VPHGDEAHAGPERERAGARAGQRPQGQGDGARAAQDARRQGPCRPRRLHRRPACRRHQQDHVPPPRRRARAHAHERRRALGVETTKAAAAVRAWKKWSAGFSHPVVPSSKKNK